MSDWGTGGAFFERYDYTFFSAYLHLHGKSADFKIPYTNMKRLFLLEAPDHVSKKFLVSADAVPPLLCSLTLQPLNLVTCVWCYMIHSRVVVRDVE